MRSDTIVALATPPGTSALAIVRLSGPDTTRVLAALFPGARLEKQPAQKLRLAWLTDENGKPVDQVMFALFRAPNSYTGEDMAEITCHGNPLLTDEIIDLCRKKGCRLARPGEFTRRAVLNRKLTLSRAEALGALITAPTPEAHRQALAAYQGETGRFVSEIAEELRELYARIEFLLGFDEEEKVDETELNRRTRQLLNRLARTLEQAQRNRFRFEPARVAIVGRPNVGKSSLFNRLLGADRAITSPIPGTTRDYIDAETFIDGLRIRLFDTCGLHPNAKNPLTRLGTKKTRNALGQMDLLIVVFDGSQPARNHDREILALTEKMPKIYIINKSDLDRALEKDFLPEPALPVSCKTGAGLNRLKRMLRTRLGPLCTSAPPVITQRQIQTLDACRAALKRSLTSLDLETRGMEVRLALDTIAEIDAPTPSEDTLNRIFARFCVGK